MKTILGSVALSTGLLSLIAIPAQADHHMEMQFGANHMMTCSYNEGKDSSDLTKATNAFTKWVKKTANDYTYYILTPAFHEDSSQWDYAMIGSWPSGAGMGSGYDAWMADDDGVGAMFADVATCDASLAAVTPIVMPEDGEGPWESGIVWFSRCDIDDGSGLAEAVGAHRRMAKAMSDMGEVSASWAFLPALGFGDIDFDYYHVQAWPSYGQLGSGFDAYFNKGGWKTQAAAQEDVVECSSPNLYDFRTMHSPE